MVKIVLDTSGLTPLGVDIRLMLVVIVAELSIDLGQVAFGPHQLGPTSGLRDQRQRHQRAQKSTR